MITTIIEKYLEAIDQATFQKMMNHLLFLEGYKFLGSPGSVVGKNKTSKGSPDSFFEDGDNYVFCECTTQERLAKGESFFKKLKSDVDHCFNEEKTKVAKDKVTKVVLAFTSKLPADEHAVLLGQVKDHNPNADLVYYSIQEIPFRLVYFPGLADKYIPGVKTTNGTFHTLPDFLEITNKGIQPSLTNPFVEREDELKKAKEFLLRTDVLVLTGGQGVGKSKIAVELLQNLEDKLGYESRVISGSPVSIWDDLPNFLLPDKNYVVFFDDANKALRNLEYLIHYLKSRQSGILKVVLTVRDYVLHDVQGYLGDIKHECIPIGPLKDEQLRKVVNTLLPEDKVFDKMVLEQICALAKGNSRLALMAGKSILDNKDAHVPNNVFTLYDEYFQKTQKEVSFLDNSDSLKALGILSFFGVLDKNNGVVSQVVSEHFATDWDGLWETFVELEKSELTDVFFKEAAKVSDQVLATYAFYKTFIDEKTAVIDFSKWIARFIDSHDDKIRKATVDQMNTYGYHELKQRLTQLVSSAFNQIEHDEDRLYKFYDTFWPFAEFETLVFVQKWIQSLKTENTELEKINYSYEVNDFVWAPNNIKLLRHFWTHNIPLCREAIRLAMELMFRQPSQIPETLKHLKESLAFQRYDQRAEFPRQSFLMEVLLDKTIGERNIEISNQVFLSMAPMFLGWDYHETEGGVNEVVIHRFHLHKSEALMKLRKTIIEHLFELFENNVTQVLSVLQEYARTSDHLDSSVFIDEQPLIQAFIEKYLFPGNYLHSVFVRRYVSALTRRSIDLSNSQEDFLNSESIKLAKLFKRGLDDDHLDLETWQEQQKAEIQSLLDGKDVKFLQNLFLNLDGIYTNSVSTGDEYWVQNGLEALFQALAESNKELYFEALGLVKLNTFSFDLKYRNIIHFPIVMKLVEPRELYDLVNLGDYEEKESWKLMCFGALSEEQIDQFFFEEFIAFLEAINSRFGLSRLASFIKFDKEFQTSDLRTSDLGSKHGNVVTLIAELLLQKSPEFDVTFGHFVCSEAGQYFEHRPDLLKKIYYLQKEKAGHFDFSGKELQAVSEYDHFFLVEYLKHRSDKLDFHRFKIGDLQVDFVWDYDEFDEIMNQALEVVISKVPLFMDFEHEANNLFKGVNQDAEKTQKAYQFISKFIVRNAKSLSHIRVILNVVVYQFNDQVLKFFKEFISINKTTEILKSLWLERNGVFSGSRVPRIEDHMIFVKSLIELVKTMPNPLDYAEHVKIWEKDIEYSLIDKQRAMKQDFTGW